MWDGYDDSDNWKLDPRRRFQVPFWWKMWFAFCLLMVLAFLGGIVFVVYRVMVYFGV